MKTLLLFFSMLTIATSFDDCSNWPTGLPSLQECCNIPTIFHFSIVYDCINECKASNKQANSLCVAACYVKKTNILENGKINKAAVLNAANLNIGLNPWTEIINASLNKCEKFIEGVLNVENQLTTLLTCIQKEASKDCIEFKSMYGCLKVEKFYENCHRSFLNCDKWPKRLTNSTILNCCNKPKLINEEINDKCKIECTFAIDNWKCMSNCLYKDIDVFGNDGNLNITTFKELLNNNSNSKANWSEVIEESIEECLKLYREKYMITKINHQSLLSGFEYCIEWETSARCIEFNEIGIGYGCYGFKKFKEECPHTLPTGPF